LLIMKSTKRSEFNPFSFLWTSSSFDGIDFSGCGNGPLSAPGAPSGYPWPKEYNLHCL
jgi:hypothetical protein